MARRTLYNSYPNIPSTNKLLPLVYITKNQIEGGTKWQTIKRLTQPGPKHNYAEEKQRRREYYKKYNIKPKKMPKIKDMEPDFKAKPKKMPKIKDIAPSFKAKPKIRKMYKGGGSISSSKVARQVRGFGAARKPKK